MNPPSDLLGLFAFIGTPTVAAWMVSNVLENWAWFQSLSSQGRNFAALLASVLLGLISYLLVHLVPAELIQQFQPLYAVVLSVVLAYVSGAIYHDATKSDVAPTPDALRAKVITTTPAVVKPAMKLRPDVQAYVDQQIAAGLAVQKAAQPEISFGDTQSGQTPQLTG